MSFSISGIKEYGLSNLWQISENYLNVGKKTYDIQLVNDKQIKLSESAEKPRWFITVLKVISYITIVLPLIALIIQTYYRSQYDFRMIEYTSPKANAQPLDPNDYDFEAVIEMIKNARESGLKIALFVGREDTQILPKEKGWFWISLEREMKHVFNEERPHLCLDYNDPTEMQKLHGLFDTVVVDVSKLRFIKSDPWDTLKPLLRNDPSSELIAEGHIGYNSISMNSTTPKFFPKRGFYEKPLSDDIEFYEKEEEAFKKWKLKVGDREAGQLYDEFLAKKTPAEIQEAIRMQNGTDYGLKLEFKRKILKENNIEPRQKNYDDLYYLSVIEYLNKLFHKVKLAHTPFPYENRWAEQPSPYVVCKGPK